jgi:hypothetical protein
LEDAFETRLLASGLPALCSRKLLAYTAKLLDMFTGLTLKKLVIDPVHSASRYNELATSEIAFGIEIVELKFLMTTGPGGFPPIPISSDVTL